MKFEFGVAIEASSPSRFSDGFTNVQSFIQVADVAVGDDKFASNFAVLICDQWDALLGGKFSP